MVTFPNAVGTGLCYNIQCYKMVSCPQAGPEKTARKKQGEEKMKTVYTRQEMQECVKTLENFYDVVELVRAPECCKVDLESLQPVADATLDGEAYDFCFAAQCVAERQRFSRLRIKDKRVFSTNCQYVRVDGQEFALIMANDVTELYCSDANGTDVDGAVFADLSRLIEQYDRWIYRDFITGAYNRRYLEQRYLPTIPAKIEQGGSLVLAQVRINKLNTICDNFGREASDRLAGYVYSLLQQRINMETPDGVVARMANNTFIITCEALSLEDFEKQLTKLYQTCHKEFRASVSRNSPFTVTMVTANWNEAPDAAGILELLDKRMREAHIADRQGLVSAL